MDKFDEHLSNESLNKKYKPCIRAAVTMGKRTINNYYSKTDECNIYRIAMSTSLHAPLLPLLIYSRFIPLVLHPSYKLHYFKKAEWNSDWIDKAKALTTKIYVRDYAQKPLFVRKQGSGEQAEGTTAADHKV